MDYVLASTDILPLISSFETGDPNILSDHSVVQFSIMSFLQFSDISDSVDENATFVHMGFKSFTRI